MQEPIQTTGTLCSYNYATFSNNANKTIVAEKFSMDIQLSKAISSPQQDQVFFPVFLILGASLLFSGMHCAVRFTANTYAISSIFIAFCRGLVQVFLSAALIFMFSASVFVDTLTGSSALLLITRGFVGSLAMMMKFAALARLPVAVAISLFSTTPIFASLFSWVFLRERLTRRDQLALLISSVGAFLVGCSEPESMEKTSDSKYVEGVVFALLAAAATGGVFTLMRAMGTKVHFMLSVFSLGTFSMLSPVLVYLSQARSLKTTRDFFIESIHSARGDAFFGLLCVALFAFSAAMCLNRGTQLTAAGRAAVIRTVDIPVNYLVAYLTLGELPKSLYELSGCCLIGISTYIAASKGVS